MPSYDPNTLANRKLFYAIRRGDPDGVRKALEQGASVHAVRGDAARPTDSTLLEGIRASWRKKNAPQVIRLLLQAGAQMDAASPDGVIPMVQAVASSRQNGVLEVFIEHAGGLDAFISKFSPDLAKLLLSRVHPRHLENDTVAKVFFGVWDRAPEDSLPQYSISSVPWIWSKMAFQPSIPSHILDQIQTRVPRPTPESLGHRLWVAWMDKLNNYTTRTVPFLFLDGLKKTPAHWWAKVPEAGEGQAPPPDDYTLVDKLLARPRPQVVRALQRAVKALPGGWDHPHAPKPAMLLKASAVSVSTLQSVLKIMPSGNYEDVLSESLRDVLSTGIEPHHRQARARVLLEQGADPRQPGKDGNTALHLVCQWSTADQAYIEEIVQNLVGAGASLEHPENQKGKTPFQILEEKHPDLAAQFLGQKMHTELPSARPCAPRPRTRF